MLHVRGATRCQAVFKHVHKTNANVHMPHPFRFTWCSDASDGPSHRSLFSPTPSFLTLSTEQNHRYNDFKKRRVAKSSVSAWGNPVTLHLTHLECLSTFTQILWQLVQKGPGCPSPLPPPHSSFFYFEQKIWLYYRNADMSLTSKLFTYLLFVPSCYLFNKYFYWSDLQYGVNFCSSAKGFSYIHAQSLRQSLSSWPRGL